MNNKDILIRIALLILFFCLGFLTAEYIKPSQQCNIPECKNQTILIEKECPECLQEECPPLNSSNQTEDNIEEDQEEENEEEEINMTQDFCEKYNKDEIDPIHCASEQDVEEFIEKKGLKGTIKADEIWSLWRRFQGGAN